MNAISTKTMSHDDWLSVRTTGIGGSDAPAIMGVSPFLSLVQLYLLKTGQAKSNAETAKTRAGHAMEAVIANLYRAETGHFVRRDLKVRIHPEHRFLLVNLDRVILGDPRGVGILECKNTSSQFLRRYEQEGYELPPSWYTQVQHAMMVTGYAWAEVAAYVDGWELRIFPVARDEAFIRELQAREIRFWRENVKRRVPPAPESAEDVLKLFPRSDLGKAVEASVKLRDQVSRLREIRERLVPLESERKVIEDAIKSFMQDAEVLTAGGAVLATWKSAKDSERFDAERFVAELPTLYREYQITVPGSRRLLLK